MSHTIKRLYYTNMFPRNCAYYGRRKGPPFPASPMKKNITKEEEKALLEIAKRLMAAIDSRGDLEARDNDSEDFIEVPVWGIQKAMEEAYLLGRMTR